jgi:thioredoxin-like negative regulator of GroEL
MNLIALKFWAEWCGPCKTLDPHLKKMKEEFPSIEFQEIDCDDDNDLVKKHNVKSVPSIILLKDGIEINRIVGAVLITPLRKAFRDFVQGEENESS